MLQWTVSHPHGLLKLAVFLPVLTAVLVRRFLGSPDLARPSLRRVFVGVLFVSLAGSSLTYLYRYRVSYEAEAMQNLGEQLRQLADEEEVLLAVSPRRVQKQITYAARRNVQRVRTVREARDWLVEHGHRRGILARIGTGHQLLGWERITVTTGELEPAQN
jgi:hypothetical protein